MKSTILQIRMRRPSMEWLEKEAAARGFSKSEFARHLIDREVDRYPAGLAPIEEGARTEMVRQLQSAIPVSPRVKEEPEKKEMKPLTLSEQMKRMRTC